MNGAWAALAIALAIALVGALCAARRALVRGAADVAAARRQVVAQQGRLAGLRVALMALDADPPVDLDALVARLAPRGVDEPQVAGLIDDLQDVRHRLRAAERVTVALVGRWAAARRPLPARALAWGLPAPGDEPPA